MKQNATGKRGVRPGLFLAKAAVSAALYAALTLLLAPLSFGAVQLRISEVLTVLPLYSSAFVWGIPLGCLIANFFSPLGGLDLLFGTAATFAGALLTRALRRYTMRGIPLWSLIMPVLCNTMLVGAELGMLTEHATVWTYLYAGLTIGLGELTVCLGLGIPFYSLIRRCGLQTYLERNQ